MKKFLLFLFSLFIGIGLFIGVGKIAGWQEIKKALLVFTGWQGMAILGLTVLMAATATWRWKEILKSQGYNIPTISLFRPYLAGFSLCYLVPMVVLGGEFFRSYFIREKFDVPLKKSLASVILDRILEVTVYLVVIVAGLIFFFLKIGLPPKNLGIILAGLLTFFIAGISFFYFKGFKRESIAKFFPRLFNQKLFDSEPLEIEKAIFQFLKPKKSFFWKGWGLTFLKSAIALVRAWLLILFLGKTMGFSALSILGFTYLALMIPIPANIGCHEAFQAFAFNSLELGAGLGTAFSMIIRGAEITVALIGLLFLFRLGIKLFEDALFKKAEKLALNNKNKKHEIQN